MSRAATLAGALFASTVLAIGAGALTSAVLARLLAAPEGASAPLLAAADGQVEAGASASPRARSRKDYLDTIKCRNYFDPASNAACKPDDPLVAGAGSSGPTVTDLNVTLVGTLVAEPASYSSALILKEGPEERATGYGIGDKLQDATIIEIRRKEVVLRRGDGSEEILGIGDDTPQRPAVVAQGDEPSSTTEGIEQLGENSYAISRDLFDKTLGDLEGLSKLGRALLHRGPDGEFDGYRLSAIRRNTLGEQIGLRNGDIIHGVNGKPLSSMQAAMDAYSQLSGGNAFQVEVTRRGQKVTLDYQVR